MENKQTFADFLTEHINSTGAKSLPAFCAAHKHIENLPPLARLEKWKNGRSLPNILLAGFEKELEFLPDEKRQVAIAIVKDEWEEKVGLSANFPDVSQRIAKKKTLDEILDNYLTSKGRKAVGIDFLRTAAKEWNLSLNGLSYMITGNQSHLPIYAKHIDKGEEAKLYYRTMQKFKAKPAESDQSDCLVPNTHLLSNEGFLKFVHLLSKRIYGKKSLEEDPINMDIEEISRKHQPNLENNLRTRNFAEMEKIGMAIYKEVIEFFSYGDRDMKNITKIGNEGMFYKYRTSQTSFANRSWLNDVSRPRTIAACLFYNGNDITMDPKNDRKLPLDEYTAKIRANTFANNFVGIDKHYSNNELKAGMLKQEIPIGEAFFIARYQSGKTRSEFAKDLNIPERNLRDIETGRFNPTQEELGSFAQNIKITDKKELSALESIREGLPLSSMIARRIRATSIKQSTLIQQ